MYLQCRYEEDQGSKVQDSDDLHDPLLEARGLEGDKEKDVIDDAGKRKQSVEARESIVDVVGGGVHDADSHTQDGVDDVHIFEVVFQYLPVVAVEYAELGPGEWICP